MATAEEYVGRTGEGYEPSPEELSEDEIREQFEDLLVEAAQAYASDPTYFIDMAEHAALIAYKRSLWQVRREAKQAEKEAVATCQSLYADTDFVCKTKTACGFGTCRFAVGDHKDVVHVGAMGKPAERPVAAKHPEYYIEEAITYLLGARGVRRPARRKGR